MKFYICLSASISLNDFDITAKFLNEKNNGDNEINIYYFKDAFLISRHTPDLELAVIDKNSFYDFGMNIQQCHDVFCRTEKCYKIDENFLYGEDKFSYENYSHFLLKLLPKIEIANNKFKHILLKKNNKKFFLEYVNHKKIDNKIIFYDKYMCCTKEESSFIVYGSFFLFNTSFNIMAGNAISQPIFIENIYNHVDISPEFNKTEKRIFIQRNGDHGNIENQYQFNAMLKKYSFYPFVLEDLTISQQKTLFSNAEIVIGAHGAGMANIIFSPSGSKVIELFTNSYGSVEFFCIAYAKNIKHYNYLSKNKSKNICSNIVIDIDSFEKNLIKILEGKI